MPIQGAQMKVYDPSFDFPDIDLPAEIRNLDEVRMFVQFVDDVMYTDTNAIPNRQLPRGVMMPCLTWVEKLPLVEIREADLIPGTRESDRDTGRPYYGKIYRRGVHEAERLVGLEAAADPEHRLGIREIVAARALSNAHRRKVNYFLYAGADWEALQTNEAMLSHLRNRLADLRANPPADLPRAEAETFEKVIEEVISAAEYGDQIQRDLVEDLHARMKLPEKDNGHIPFARRDRRYDMALKRTGLRRISENDQKMVDAMDKLSNIQQSSGDPEIKQLLTNMNQLLGMLVAERTEPAKKGAK